MLTQVSSVKMMDFLYKFSTKPTTYRFGKLHIVVDDVKTKTQQFESPKTGTGVKRYDQMKLPKTC